jgi:hypothetical protein
MKTILVSLLFFISNTIQAQNIGIGTTTPTGPLSFPNTFGNKIVLYGNGNAPHYGFGIQGQLLQIYTAIPANISFGFGRSDAFTERMRIFNRGSDGLLLNGRILLRNGTEPLDLDYGSGIWMYKPDNSDFLGFMGVQNNQNLGFYGGPAGWGFTYDAINSRVGIGNNNPNAPLAFPPSLGKKITLYPGATGDVGFAVAGNRLQIYSDNPNADVAIGYDAAGVFNERFAFKPTGSLAVNGNVGLPGQALVSSGSASSPIWSPSTRFIYENSIKKVSTTYGSVGGAGNPSTIVVPDLSHTIVASQKVMALISWTVATYAVSCTFCGDINLFCLVAVNGQVVHQLDENIGNGTRRISSGSTLVFLDPGTYNIEILVRNHSTSIVGSVGGNGSGVTSNMCIVLFPF